MQFSGQSGERGSLFVVEAKKDLPFEIKRVYYVKNVPDGKSRGAHAHKTLEQVIIAVEGSVNVELDDGRNTSKFILNNPDTGLYLPPGYWRRLDNFSPGSILMALASACYDPQDYIRDYDKYLKWRSNLST